MPLCSGLLALFIVVIFVILYDILEDRCSIFKIMNLLWGFQRKEGVGTSAGDQLYFIIYLSGVIREKHVKNTPDDQKIPR